MMDIPVLYEDEALLAINKPPGLVVNRAQSVKEETIQDWAAVRLGLPTGQTTTPKPQKVSESGEIIYDVEAEFYARAGIVHRIDKETSGVLLIAKSSKTYGELKRQFQDREVKKTYLAIAHGILVPEVGEIRAPVGRLPWNRERFGVLPGGKDAVTKYKVREAPLSIAGESYSVVELYPETGRTHQIRIHLKYINHPILGDYLYAGRKTSRDDRTWAPRVMLHANKLECRHPTGGQVLAIEAPIPDDMKRIIHESA